MHIRAVSRFQLIAALSVTISLVYFIYDPDTIEYTIVNWTGPSRNIIAFGDSTSGLGNNTIWTKENAFSEDLAQLRWIEVLHEKLKCNDLYSYALSTNVGSAGFVDAIADNDILLNATANGGSRLKRLPDLKQQVQNWLNDREGSGATNQHDEYIITVTLGRADTLAYARLDLKDAKRAVEESVQAMFSQLERVASLINNTNLVIVVPTLWDTTFSPGFAAQPENHDAASGSYSTIEHKAVYLIQYWNTVLSNRAAKWTLGRLYVPDWHSWLLNQLRASQMQRSGISDISVDASVFNDVSTPCLKTTIADKDDHNAVDTSICDKPKQHLWWDDTHFGSLAHELLGNMVTDIINSKEMANAGAYIQSTASQARADR